jgi:hypothetical protein
MSHGLQKRSPRVDHYDNDRVDNPLRFCNIYISYRPTPYFLAIFRQGLT